MKPYFTIFLLFFCTSLFSQYTIYNDASSIVTGSWADASGGGSASLMEVTTDAPYEGTRHYQFNYNYSEWWAGIGFNFDSWGTVAPLDWSG
ncbi:MAG: hypothetical protein AB8G22_25520, partial [Saprospiraceae bacterium]